MKIDKIIKLSKILKENNFDDDNIEIIIKIKSDELLNRINEEFYFRNRTTDSEPIKHTDEIIVNINGITFKYVLSD